MFFFLEQGRKETEKKQNLRQTTSRSFQKDNKYPDITTTKSDVSFTAPVEFSIWLREWSSEKFFISKSDRKKSNLKKKKKRIELCRVEFVLMVVQLSLTDCKSAGHHSCYLNRLISWGLCSDIQTIYSSHWIMLSELF